MTKPTDTHDVRTDVDDPAISPEGRFGGAEGSAPEADPTGPSGVRRWLSRWLLGGTFVGGIIVGVILVGLLNLSTPDFLAAGQPSPSPTASGFNRVEVAADVRVNAACLRVINEAQDIYGPLTGLNQAITDVNLKQLDDIVRQLQPIQPRLERDLRDCQVDATATEPGGLGASPAPTTSALPPSGSTGPESIAPESVPPVSPAPESVAPTAAVEATPPPTPTPTG